MKFLLTSVALIQAVAAFPAVMNDFEKRQGTTCSVSSLCNKDTPISNSQLPYDPNNPTAAQLTSQARNQGGALTPVTIFNAAEQFPSITGQYAYASPAAGDIRGPCPGLNAAANHGYLPRNGVPSIVQTVTGLGALYGMSADLAGFLAAYAVIFDGDVLTQTWSIGGPPQQNGLPTGAQGISWSHNKYEGDTSISRCDAYINNGDAHSLSTTRFKYAYDYCTSGYQAGRCTLDKWSQLHTANTFRAVQDNPYYFAPLFSTTLVAPAAYNFVVAMMSNHTAQQPDGYLDVETFKSFFAVSGSPGSFVWNKGQERVPPYWYRRPTAQPYTAHTGVFGDLLSEFAAYPNSFRFGGNVNGVNTYQGANLSDFTGGVFTSENILQGSNFACLIYQNIQQGLPDSLVVGALSGAANALFSQYGPALLGGASCPQLAKFNNNNLPPYAGRTYSPTGPGTNC